MTEYVILKEKERESGHWIVVGGDPSATSARAAIRDYLSSAPVSETQAENYVAVPVRSWQPVKVAVESALKFS